jgi:probable HAF family extracellular repeat protein
VTRINDRRQMVGIYSTTTGHVGDDPARRAFLLRRGRFTRIDAPDAVYTQALGINNHTHVVGEFVDTNGKGHGFLWKDGRLTTIDVPGSEYTAAVDINDRGTIVGVHARDLDAEPIKVRGFVLDRGRYTSFAAPDVAITYPFGINNKGKIVGATSNDTAITSQGFLLRKGTFRPISFPDSPTTGPTDVNDAGTIIGAYLNTDAAWDPEQPGGRPQSMMAQMWESMAFAQDLAEKRTEDNADKDTPKDPKKPKANASKKPPSTDKKKAKKPEPRPAPRPEPRPEPRAEPREEPRPERSEPRQSEPAKHSKRKERPEAKEQASAKERPKPRKRPETEPRETEERRREIPDQRVFRVAPATDRLPTPDRADEDTHTITAEPSEDSTERTGLIQIQTDGTRPPEDLDRTAAVSGTTNRMAARGVAVALPLAAAWLLMMTRRRALARAETRRLEGQERAPSAAQQPLHPTGFWHGRRTPSGRRTVTCDDPKA